MDLTNLTPGQIEFLANKAEMSPEEYISAYSNNEPGKTNDSMETDPPASQNTETSAGESSSGDISLGSPQIDSVDLDWKELFKSEDDVVVAVNEQISKYGLIAEAANIFGDAINIRKRESKKDEQGFLEKYSTMVPELIYNTVTEPFTSIGVGPDRDVKDMLADINAAVQSQGDTNYLVKNKEAVSTEWEGYKQATTAPELSDKDLLSSWSENKSDEFQEIADNASGEVVSPFMFDDPTEYKRYKQWENDEPMSSPSEAELDNFKVISKEIYSDEQSSKYMNDLEPWQRETIDALSRNELEVLEADMNDYSSRFTKFEESEAEITSLVKEFEINPTIESLDNIRKKESQLSSDIDKINSIRQNLINKSEDLPAFVSSIDNATKDYNRLRQLGSNFKAMVPDCLLYTSPSPRDRTRSRMPSSA